MKDIDKGKSGNVLADFLNSLNAPTPKLLSKDSQDADVNSSEEQTTPQRLKNASAHQRPKPAGRKTEEPTNTTRDESTKNDNPSQKRSRKQPSVGSKGVKKKSTRLPRKRKGMKARAEQLKGRGEPRKPGAESNEASSSVDQPSVSKSRKWLRSQRSVDKEWDPASDSETDFGGEDDYGQGSDLDYMTDEGSSQEDMTMLQVMFEKSQMFRILHPPLVSQSVMDL